MANNLENLSDAELDKLVMEKLSAKPAPQQTAPQIDLDQLSDEELDRMVAEKLAGRNPSQSLSDLPKDDGSVNEGVQFSQQPVPQRSFGEEVLDRAQTQLESFGNAVSLGYLPQIQAAFEKINPDPSGGLDDQLRKEGFTVPSQDYVNLRDENIKRQQAQEERNPYDAVAGSLGGMAVTTPIIAAGSTAMNATKALGGIARLKDSARVGGVLGLVSNPGDTEGVVSPLQATQRLSNTATGGAVGAAGQVVGEGATKVSNTVKNAPALLDKIGNITAVKAIGAYGKDFKKLFRKGSTAHEIGDTLLKNNIVQAGDTLEDIAEKSLTAKLDTGKKIGDIYKEVNAKISDPKFNSSLSPKAKRLLDITKLDGVKIADKVELRLKDRLKNNSYRKEIMGKVQDVLDDLRTRGNDIDLMDVKEIRVNLDKKINYDKTLKDMPEVQQELKSIRDALRKSEDNRIRVLGRVAGDPKKISELKEANKLYGHYSKAEAISSNRAREVEGHRWLSLTENLAGGTGATIGAMTGDSPEERFINGLKGFVAGAAIKKSDKFTAPVVANGLKRASLLLKKPANFAKYTEPLMEAAKKSPEEFQALINQFGKDPEFIRLTKPQGAR